MSQFSLSAQIPRDFAPSIADVLHSTAAKVMAAISIVLLAWPCWLAVSQPDQFVLRAAPVIFILGVSSCLALLLLNRHFVLAQALWLTSLMLGVTAAVYYFDEPAIGFGCSLLPLLSLLFLGRETGLLVLGGLAAWCWLLTTGLFMPALPAAYAWGYLSGGLLTGLIGWYALDMLLMIAHWSADSHERMERTVEEVRQKRQALMEVQEDLVHMNETQARLLDRLESMHQVAEEARHAKEAFVATVSHELRTPLNMIIGFSEMITQSPQVYGGQLPTALLADIATIQRNSRHLSELVDDILDLSQVQAGRMALTKEWADLGEIVEAAITATRPLFEFKSLAFQCELDPALPPLYCDRTRIRQVILNLLSNAGRFTDAGGVTIRATLEDRHILFTVTDTGPGIAVEDQARLFEPFQQLTASVFRRHDGSGLGLSICKQFVEMHDGKMWVESQLGVGTTFAFRLPVTTPAGLAADSESRNWLVNPYHQYEPRPRLYRAPLPKVLPRFILLEPGRALYRWFSRYLDNVELVVVDQPEAAVREIHDAPAQALIINAPPSQPTETLIGQLGEIPYITPIITCWVPGEDAFAQQLGVARYLVKPVSREMLLNALASIKGPVRQILVVDDEPEMLQLLGRMLISTEQDYQIIRASTGRQALELLRERRPDVMILDLVMPEVDGFQVIKEKSLDPALQAIPIIVVSANDPMGEPIISNTLTVTRSGGLSVRALLRSILALSETLIPAPTGPLSDDPTPPESLAG